MKNYLPQYRRRKGEPRNLSKSRLVKESLSKEDKELIDKFINKLKITMKGEPTLFFAESMVITLCDVIEKPLSQLNEDDVEHFVRLVNNTITKRSVRHKLFWLLKKFLEIYYLSINIKIIKNKKETGKNENSIKKSDLITVEELEKLIRAADSLKLKALTTLLFESAGRPDEIRNLKWKDIKFNDDGFCEVYLRSGKKNEGRTIIVRDCVLHLQRWKQEYLYPNISPLDFVFPGKERINPLSAGGLQKIVKTLAKKADIDTTHRKLCPYVFRHTRLSFVRQRLKGANYEQFAGHTERMGANYTHLDLDDLKEALIKEIYPTKELNVEEKDEINKLKNEMAKLRNENKQNIEYTINLLLDSVIESKANGTLQQKQLASVLKAGLNSRSKQ